MNFLTKINELNSLGWQTTDILRNRTIISSNYSCFLRRENQFTLMPAISSQTCLLFPWHSMKNSSKMVESSTTLLPMPLLLRVRAFFDLFNTSTKLVSTNFCLWIVFWVLHNSIMCNGEMWPDLGSFSLIE